MGRAILFLATLLAVAPTAGAGGFYISESLGGASYRGDLRAYGDGAFRFQVGAGYRRGDWTVEVLGGTLIPPDWFAYDCLPDEDCTVDPKNGEYSFFGADLKRRWTVVQSRWNGLGVRFALHGGPRYFWGQSALTGYDGIGLSGGAMIEGDIWVLGYTLDFGMDVMTMSIPVDALAASAPYVMLGVKIGWM